MLWEYAHLSTNSKDMDNYFGEFIKGTDKYFFGITGTRYILLGLQIQVQKYDQIYWNNTEYKH